ncbi:hypothetical protein KGV52_00545 [Candidatus Gracilibacteria bacterium]|nr:hypothetical protein [Candidatus Gracilibacteria bacterium]
MNIQKNNGEIALQGENATAYFHIDTNMVKIDELEVNYPGEYEKGGILLEVKEYEKKLFYSFSIDGKNTVIITNDTFEQKEEILDFFGDIDVLLIVGTKNAAKVFENIEARIVIPYGEGRDVFLNTLGQDSIEEVKIYKVKNELPVDDSIFVKLV